MRVIFTLSLLFTFWGMAFAQPANDECGSATEIMLSAPAPCPNTSPAFDNFTFTNVDATPTTPYPSFTGCDGGDTPAAAGEVWFHFQSTSNIIEIIVNGLNTPNITLFSGDNCAFLNAIDCAVGATSSGTVTLTSSAVGEGLSYYIMVAGEDPTDQGSFDLDITSSFSCNPCLFANDFTVSPPPVNGTFSSGSSITFCYIVNAWEANASGTIEWLHSLEVQFGSGWDLNSLVANPPPPCGADGQWDWYPNGWTSCATGTVFGAGFAYDSSSGIGCGGSPGDGDPGNNWGDGTGNCADIGITAPAVQFCWTINTPSTCPPGNNGDDLSMTAIIHSDGESGSWTQIGCNSGTEYDFFASLSCCDDQPPSSFPTGVTCPGADDGMVDITAFPSNSGAFLTYTLFDQFGNDITTIGPTDVIPVTFPDLAPGDYSVLVQNPANGCNLNTNFTIDDTTGPVVTVTDNFPVCLGNPAILTASINPATPPVSFSWTGPGFSANTATIMVTTPGTYTVTGSSNGCAGPPVDVVFAPIEATIQITTSDNAVCAGDIVTLEAIGATNNITWTNTTTGANLGSANPLQVQIDFDQTIEVYGEDANGCGDTEVTSITVDAPPVLNFGTSGTLCAGNTVVVTVSGADTYIWADNSSTSNPRIFTLNAGTYQFDVQGTSATTGCSSIITVDLEINPVPTPTVTPSAPIICAGDDVTLTASGTPGSSFNWSTGDNNIASITVSPTMTTLYTVTETLNGCSASFEVTVTVQEALPAPTITCGMITSAEVEFNWAAIPGATGYTVTIGSGQTTGSLSGTTYTVTGLNPSEDVTITVEATGGVCGGLPTTFTCTSLDCPPVDMTITPVADICLDSGLPTISLEVTIANPIMDGDSLWNGTGVIDPFSGTFDPVLAGVGAHEVIFTYSEGLCSYRDTIIINIFATPDPSFSVSNNDICTTDSTTITYTGDASINATYTWDFDGGIANPSTGQGPFIVNWTDGGDKVITLTVAENGCTSEPFIQNVTVNAPLAAPAIICGTSTTTSVEFNWNAVPGAAGYNVTVLTGQTGTLTGTTYTVNNLQPEEVVTIEVSTQDDGPCANVSSQATCTALACPGFSLVIDPVADICLVANAPTITLTGSVTGGEGTGQITWSGPGIVDAIGGTLAPSAAGVGTHTITMTYTEGPCVATETMDINIFDTPTGDFGASATTVCIGEETIISYAGNASINATYTWNFVGGDATTGMGQGPHTVSWPTAGDKIISLIVNENGCASEVFELTVQVESPLMPPVVNCDPSSTEITFTWDDVVGATSYNVTVQSGQTGTQNGNSFTLTGLVPGEQVDITVEAVGPAPCGNVSTATNCIAEDCPDVQIDIDVVDPICLYPITVITDLNATASGGLGGGDETWDGPGIIDALTGTFDPQVAGVGTHTINYTYSEGTCTYNSSITIIVNAVPVAAFTANDPVCLNAINDILFTGSAGSGATYDWIFDGGTTLSGTNEGPYEVSWPTSGTKNISLTVTENSCISEPFDLAITVVDTIGSPIISCESTDTSITFSWLDVAGADSYQVIGSPGLLVGNTYTISGILPGTEESITVIAETTNACGNTSTSTTCIASDCPEVSLNITASSSLCADDGIQTFTANPQGGAGTGTGVWFGNGITNGATGDFDPTLVSGSTVTIQYIYTENVICVYDTTFDVIIYEIPDASFTVETPICVDGTSATAILATAPNSSTFDWTFDGGMSNLTNTDEGPHTLNWATAGDKTVSLQISNNGCLSPIETQTVEVVELLNAPVVMCDISTTNTVTFFWDAVDGATSYQVMDIDGPTGTLNGTTYVVTGLTPEQIVNIEVTAVSNGICGNTMATGTCQAMACPTVSIEVTGPQAVCSGDDAVATFNITGSTNDFEISYSINGGFPVATTISDGDMLDFDQLAATTEIQIISYTNILSPECSYTGTSNWTINVNEPLNPGLALDPARLCMSTNEVIVLADLIEGADAGGQWTETSNIPSLPGGFNAGQGIFTIPNQVAGTYEFTYQLTSSAPCPTVETAVAVVIDPLPIADAGEDQTRFCNMGLVSIGSGNSSSGAGINYTWTAPNGVTLSDPNDLLIDVSEEGVYSLEVSNEFGCIDTDEAQVSIKDDVPAGELSFNGISCFSASDGSIFLQNVSGGTPPYIYSLNGGDFTSQSVWTGLGPDTYNLIVQDVNGCFSELEINLTEPDELVVNLVTNAEDQTDVIEFGDSIRLEAIFNSTLEIDTILWLPQGIADGKQATVWVNPTETTSYSVTIIDENGCRDSDGMTIFVEKPRPVYIPNVFSPNDDGINDILFIWANDKQVVEIKSFVILNRWGESVFEHYNFQANDPTLGWDGKFRGKIMNPAVFVYVVEVEFTDGEIILYKGDITLVR